MRVCVCVCLCVLCCACVRSEKNEVVVDGQIIDSETISVSTPNYESYGALAVDVRVSINGEGWTVNKLRFNYFANTAARNCIAYGPGLLAQGVCGVDMPFLIQVGAVCMCGFFAADVAWRHDSCSS